ncbi:MAG TPA: hypothetical protein VG826_35500 [Pirellulales bacterium]|nr:hypothetical protein [Pirellulales bacterium]
MAKRKKNKTTPSAKRPKSAGKLLTSDTVGVESIPVEDAGSPDLINQIQDRLVAMEKAGYKPMEVFPVNDLRGATRQIIVYGKRK